MTLVHVMFLSYMPTNRHLPSLYDGSRGADSPSFIGTMKMLRLPSSFSSPSVSLGLDTTSLLPCFLVRGGNRYPETPGLWITGQPLTGASRGDGRLSSQRDPFGASSRGCLMYICPALRPRPLCERLTLLAPPHCCSP
jgi:hypothetical protein